MTPFKPALKAIPRAVSLTLLGASMLALASNGHAQEAPINTQETPELLELEELVVTGFRQSLTDALNTKRNANSIVDSISSEGIGRFPDLNLGESLQRITGVQIERGERRRGEIAIRGLPRNYALTRVNGQAMGNPDLRNPFAFGVFESSIFSGADVIKTPTADLDDGGLSGIVNLRTARPLNAENDQYSISVGTSYEELADELSPNAVFKATKRFSESAAGSLAVAWSNQQYRRDVVAITDYDPNGNDIQVADDFRYQSNPTEGDRISIASDFEWQASENLLLSFNATYSDYEQTTEREQTRIRNCRDEAGAIVGDTAVTSTHTNCRVEAENRIRKDFDSTYALSLGGVWERDLWKVEGKLHFTEGEHDGNLIDLRRRFNNIPGTVSVNTGAGNPEGFGISFAGFDPGQLSTWSFSNDDVQNRLFPGGANATSTDEELALQFDFTRDLDIGIIDSVKFGGKYRDRSQQNVDLRANADDVNFDLLTDSILRRSVIGTGDFFDGDFSDFSLLVPDASDALAVLLPINTTRPLNDEGFVLAQGFGATYDTDQDILAAYVMANLDSSQLASPWARRLTGNIGLRYVDTDRSTDTFQRIDGVFSPISTSANFDNFLPSINLAYEINENLLLRASYTETIVRPNPDEFRSGRRIDIDDESISVDNGNPNLEPFEADSIDLSLEWYNRPGSAVTLAYFSKEVRGFIDERLSCPGSIAGLEGFITGQISLQGGNNPAEDCFDQAGVKITFSDTFNSPKSFDVEGFELGVLQNFDFLPAPWSGLGVQANYTYISADDVINDDGEITALEEISENTVNLIGFYETDLWGVRLAYNYRDEYFTGVGRGTNNGDRTIDTRGQWDVSFNYNPTEQLSFGLEALNINDERVFEYDGITSRLRNYATEGRTFVLTATYNF